MDAARKKDILSYLKEHGRASVKELADALFVSEATVRRDLAEMRELGLAERTHGGAILTEGTDERSIFVRKEKNAREKLRAASVALKYLPDFQTVFIDNSSTCLALLNSLPLGGKTVVTNGIQVALHAAKQGDATVILTGGEVRYDMTATAGSLVVNGLRDLRFDLALLSCAAVDAAGSFERSLETMQIKKTALSLSKRAVLVFDGSKIGGSAHYLTAPLGKYDVIATDADDTRLAPLRTACPRIRNR